jgi:hypothetical protein
MTSPSQAKIVYTAANQKILQHTTVDLNGDGVADFALNPGSGTNSGMSFRYLDAAVSRRNRLVGQSSCASALKAGATVGPAQQLVDGEELMAAWSFNGNRYRGPWMNGGKGVTNRYLGIRFVIKGRIHYGWARLTVTPTKNFVATLTGYAYETIANKPIIAGKTKGPDEIASTAGQSNPASRTASTPQPHTLGLLAVGAPGLSIWRREESHATA